MRVVDFVSGSVASATGCIELLGRVLREPGGGTDGDLRQSTWVSAGPTASEFTLTSATAEVHARVWWGAPAKLSLTVHADRTVDLAAMVERVAEVFGLERGSVAWHATVRTPQAATAAADKAFATDDVQRQMLGGESGYWRRRLSEVQSRYQNVQIWATDDRSPLANGAEPSKLLYLDGVLQSSTRDEHVYHESLVHPAMLAHPRGPQRVAILGGGEGASLREVLKHRSVAEAVMIELDNAVVEESLTHLQQLNNCSWDHPRYTSCYDDPRATLVTQDCVKWFRDQFGAAPCADGGRTARQKFDVVILDLLDPELRPDTEFAKYLYSTAQIDELACAMKADGVFVAQIGGKPLSGDPADLEAFRFKGHIVDTIARRFVAGGTFVYDVHVPSYLNEWSFVLACKSPACIDRFHTSVAAAGVALNERLLPRARHSLRFFDGGTMAKLAQSSIGWSQIQCMFHRDSPFCTVAATSARGQLMVPAAAAVPWDSVAVHGSGGVAVAARDIHAGEQISLWAPTSMSLTRSSYVALQQSNDTMSGAAELVRWLKHHGRGCPGVRGGLMVAGLVDAVGDGAAATCNGSSANLGPVTPPPSGWFPEWSRRPLEACGALQAIAPIKKGARLVVALGAGDWDEHGEWRPRRCRRPKAARPSSGRAHRKRK